VKEETIAVAEKANYEKINILKKKYQLVVKDESRREGGGHRRSRCEEVFHSEGGGHRRGH
jgi:hypothetical protein